MKARLVAAGLLVLITHGAAPARAQTTERAGARAAADEGFDAFEARQSTVALDRFERAESLVHSLVHLSFIARCESQLGRLVEAKEVYLRVLREALPADAAPALKDAQRAARAELGALEARIPLVDVVVKGTGETPPIVTLDGERIPNALLGVSFPVNPGKHTWQASSGGAASEPVERTLREGSRETIQLDVPQPPPTTPPNAPARATASTPTAQLHSSPPPPESVDAPAGFPWAAGVGFGVAAVGVGAGVTFLLRKNALDSKIEATCRQGVCPGTERNLEREDAANAAGRWATIGFIAAGAGVGAAVTLLLLQPSAKPPTSASLTPWLGAGSAGVHGTF